MITLILVIFLILAPAASPAQTLKASVGKQDIYLDSGTVTGGAASNVMDLYKIRFARHPAFERLVIDVQQLWERVPADKPCVFSVDYEPYPFRLVLALDSVRLEISAQFPKFSNSDYISGMSRKRIRGSCRMAVPNANRCLHPAASDRVKLLSRPSNPAIRRTHAFRAGFLSAGMR